MTKKRIKHLKSSQKGVLLVLIVVIFLFGLVFFFEDSFSSQESEQEDAIIGQGAFGYRSPLEDEQEAREQEQAESAERNRRFRLSKMELRPNTLYIADYRDGARNCNIFCEEKYPMKFQGVDRRYISSIGGICGKAQIPQEDRIISCSNQAATDLAIFRYNEIQCLCVLYNQK